MARRGQIFSVDALVMIVMLIFIVGAVTDTSSTLKSEIADMLGWYERVNIAENMLDVLTKSPGEPDDWYLHPENVLVVGMRDSNISYALDYKKFLAFNSSREQIKDRLVELAMEKDFKIVSFVSDFNVDIVGSYPRLYLDNVTFSRNGGNLFDIEGSPNGNDFFSIESIAITRGGQTYANSSVTLLADTSHQKIPLVGGDIVEFVTTSTTYITTTKSDIPPELCNSALSTRGTCVIGPLPPGTKFTIYVSPHSNFQIQMNGKDNWQSIRLTAGQGQVIVTVSARDNQVPQIVANYTPAPVFEGKNEPSWKFAVINGSIVDDESVITASMDRSPWIEVEKRISVLNRLEYNLSAQPSRNIPMVYGVLKTGLPVGGYFKVSVPSGEGNLAFVIISGTQRRALFVYRESETTVRAVIVYDNSSIEPTYYQGDATSVAVPLEALFGKPSPGDTIGVWFVSINGWDRSSVEMRFEPSLRAILSPKFDVAILKLWVWDDS